MAEQGIAHRLKRLSRARDRGVRYRLAENRGAAALWGALASLVLILVAASVLDVYRLSTTRNWAYQVASNAALRAVSRARDFASITEIGSISLDEVSAREEATLAMETALAEKGLSQYVLDVRVLPQGGTVHGYPPLTQASQTAERNWSSAVPAVGVYLEVPVPVAFFGWVNAVKSVPVHVFAAAALTDVR